MVRHGPGRRRRCARAGQDRIGVRPQRARGLLADRASPVPPPARSASVNKRPRRERNAHHREVVGRDRVALRPTDPPVADGTSLDVKAPRGRRCRRAESGPAAAAARRRAARADARPSRRSSPSTASSFRVRLAHHRDLHRQHVVGIEARVDAEQAADALDHQAGADRAARRRWRRRAATSSRRGERRRRVRASCGRRRAATPARSMRDARIAGSRPKSERGRERERRPRSRARGRRARASASRDDRVRREAGEQRQRSAR